jgi:cell fate regulator YaaT (PSP1 superfamily)
LALYGKPRYLGIVALPEDFAPAPDARVVVLSPRGEEIARLVGPLDERQEGTYRRIRTLTEQGEGPSRSEPAVSDLTYQGEASEEDARAATELREEEQQVLAFCRDPLGGRSSVLSSSRVSQFQDRRKLFLYFTAENRIDFRN